MKDLRFWLALVRTPGLHWHALEAMLASLQSAECIFSAARRDLAPFDLSPTTRDALLAPDWERVDRHLRRMQASGCGLVPAAAPEFPRTAALLCAPPMPLLVRGHRG